VEHLIDLELGDQPIEQALVEDRAGELAGDAAP
jgi:hypothetical protein